MQDMWSVLRENGQMSNLQALPTEMVSCWSMIGLRLNIYLLCSVVVKYGEVISSSHLIK
jgi:hypothetical protein